MRERGREGEKGRGKGRKKKRKTLGACSVTATAAIWSQSFSFFFISFLPASCLSATGLLYSIINGKREKCWNWNQFTFLLVINLVPEEIEFRNKCGLRVAGRFKWFHVLKTVQIWIQKYFKRTQHESQLLLNCFGYYLSLWSVCTQQERQIELHTSRSLIQIFNFANTSHMPCSIRGRNSFCYPPGLNFGLKLSGIC